MQNLYRPSMCLPFEFYTKTEFDWWKSIVLDQSGRHRTKEELLQMAYYYLAIESYSDAEICLLELLEIENDAYANFLLALIISQGLNGYSKTDQLYDYVVEAINQNYYYALKILTKRNVSDGLILKLFQTYFEKWKNSISDLIEKDRKANYFMYLLLDGFRSYNKINNKIIVQHIQIAIHSESTDAIQDYFFGLADNSYYFREIPKVLANNLCAFCKNRIETLIKNNDFVTICYLYQMRIMKLDGSYGYHFSDNFLLISHLNYENINKYATSIFVNMSTKDACYKPSIKYLGKNNSCYCETQIGKGKWKMMYLCTFCKTTDATSTTKYKTCRSTLKQMIQQTSTTSRLPSLRISRYSLPKKIDSEFCSKLYDYGLYLDFLNIVYECAQYNSTSYKVVDTILAILYDTNPFDDQYVDENMKLKLGKFECIIYSEYSYSIDVLENVRSIVNNIFLYLTKKIAAYSKIIKLTIGDDFLDGGAERKVKDFSQILSYRNTNKNTKTDFHVRINSKTVWPTYKYRDSNSCNRQTYGNQDKNINIVDEDKNINISDEDKNISISDDDKNINMCDEHNADTYLNLDVITSSESDDCIYLDEVFDVCETLMGQYESMINTSYELVMLYKKNIDDYLPHVPGFSGYEKTKIHYENVTQ